MDFRFKGKANLDSIKDEKLRSFIKDHLDKLEGELKKDFKKQSKKLKNKPNEKFNEHLKRRARWVREKLTDELKKRSRRLERRLESDFTEALRAELYSDNFQAFLRSLMAGNTPNADFKKIAQNYVNDDVEVTTTGGTVTGTVTSVGEDYLVLQETNSTQLIVPFTNTSAIRPQ